MDTSIRNSASSSDHNLKRAFEEGVSALQQVSAGPEKRYNVPIVQRLSAPEKEKRALSDAARALAQLWKIRPHPAR